MATLTRQGDRAAVEMAEVILDHYTLLRARIEADSFSRTTAGGAPLKQVRACTRTESQQRLWLGGPIRLRKYAAVYPDRLAGDE